MKYIILLIFLSCSTTRPHPSKIKNVIYLIGDGMGPQQVGLLQTYIRFSKTSKLKQSGFESFLKEKSYFTLSTHNPYKYLVIDSAASATHLSTGALSRPGMVGMDYNGKPVETILEYAKKRGKSTGLVSDTRLTHATPAAFATHVLSRSQENEIADQYINSPVVDIMLSGGLRHFVPKKGTQFKIPYTYKSKREDNKDLLKAAKEKGYELSFDRFSLKKSKSGKVLGLFSDSGMDDGITYSLSKNSAKRIQPSLLEMTQFSLDRLSKNEKGFFLMVEGGQIDWAGHANDVGTLLHEMLKFNEVIEYVFEWVKNRDDTVVILTADHETGSFGFTYSRYNIPKEEKAGKWKYQASYNFGDKNLIDKIYNQKKSFQKIFEQFWSEKNSSPEKLRELVNHNSDFKITLNEAKTILKKSLNDTYFKGNKDLESKYLPDVVGPLRYFYLYGDESHIDQLGLTLAKQNNATWGTGTHTHTPVPFILFGPEHIKNRYRGILKHTKIGELGFQLFE